MRTGILAVIILGLALLFLVPIVSTVFWMASPGSWMMRSGMVRSGMMGWSRFGFGWVPMLLGPLLFLVFIGLIILGLYYLFSGRGITEPSRDRSVELLRERFAKGEISEEQFRKMKEAL